MQKNENVGGTHAHPVTNVNISFAATVITDGSQLKFIPAQDVIHQISGIGQLNMLNSNILKGE